MCAFWTESRDEISARRNRTRRLMRARIQSSWRLEYVRPNPTSHGRLPNIRPTTEQVWDDSCLRHECVGRSRYTAPLILNLGKWWASYHGRFTPWERAAGTHRTGRWVGPRAWGGGIKLLPLPGIELDHSLVTRPTELRRLRLSVCIPNSRQPLILRWLPSTHTIYCCADLLLPSNCASSGSNVDYAGGQRECDPVGGKQIEWWGAPKHQSFMTVAG